MVTDDHGWSWIVTHDHSLTMIAAGAMIDPLRAVRDHVGDSMLLHASPPPPAARPTAAAAAAATNGRPPADLGAAGPDTGWAAVAEEMCGAAGGAGGVGRQAWATRSAKRASPWTRAPSRA